MDDAHGDLIQGYVDAKEYFWIRLLAIKYTKLWEEKAIIQGKEHDISKRTIEFHPSAKPRELFTMTCQATALPDPDPLYKKGFIKRLDEVCPLSEFFVAFRFNNLMTRSVSSASEALRIEEESLDKCLREESASLSGLVISRDSSEAFVFNNGEIGSKIKGQIVSKTGRPLTV